MKIGVLGTGVVGQTIASKLKELGHEVMIGSRTADNEKADGTFADAAAFGEVVFNCTLGEASVEALRAAGPENLSGKTLIDVSNPLDFSQGMPPTLSVSNTDSLSEQIQREFPEAKVVKALNTINADVMVEPGRVPGEHNIFVCGNDDAAKGEARELISSFGWPAESIIDLGDISAARGTEGYLQLWLRLMGAIGTAEFNIKIVR
jgi:predicted dinucleotide-binding enzyme